MFKYFEIDFDVRTIVLDGNIIASIKRKKSGGDFRTNKALGGDTEPYKLNEEEKKLIEDIEAFIGQYEIGGNLGLVKLDPAICESLNIDRGAMAEMSSEDIYHSAYLIQAYIGKTTNQKNKNKPKNRKQNSEK